MYPASPTCWQLTTIPLPLTALIDALRANVLQGGGLASAGPQMGVLAAWLVVCAILAVRFFRWE